MKKFLDEDFLLKTKTSEKLYFDFAEGLPIIDYHCHLSPEEISSDKRFKNLTKIWLDGDHYKWRAMRANGINEYFCTGDADDFEKFEKWAETVPCTLKNPLYHWTHLELKNTFGITKLLDSSTAREIYNECSEKLNSEEFSVRNILRKMNVEALCTTDDPIDSLEHHQKIRKDNFEIKILPTWRPDKSIQIESPGSFNKYINQLGTITGQNISEIDELMSSLKKRHDFFQNIGCRISDHGLDRFYADDYTNKDIDLIFKSIRGGKQIDPVEVNKFKSFMLYELALFDFSKGWVQQFHIGALRNNSTRMKKLLGPDIGFDSIGDLELGKSMSKFFDRLDEKNKLGKTILYNINPRDNELFATMAGNFNDGSILGKMQYGASWWFLDQKAGIINQINVLSNMGLLSRFIGMLTDSRSFLSYSRHEYFRRILCDVIGNDVENGELPNDIKLLGNMIKNICYLNARNYFGL